MRKQYQNNYRSNTGLKGVYKKKRAGNRFVYIATIRNGLTMLYLGTFRTAKEAGLAYNQKALELRGKDAVLNSFKGD